MPKKILVVDDEELIVELISINLISAGYEVFSALDGKAGLSLALTEKPALIILDVRMPELDGFSVCRAVKENSDTKDIPVIFLTAATQKKDYESASASDCDHILSKPFDPDELVGIINSVLKEKSE